MSSDEEQLRILEDAIKVVREQAFYMKRAIDEDSLKLALDHATEMLRELRTNLLTPKNYYELYMKVLDEMRELEEYLQTLRKNGRCLPFGDIYLKCNLNKWLTSYSPSFFI
jgi:vacuolar protein sorting-associated protein 35